MRAPLRMRQIALLVATATALGCDATKTAESTTPDTNTYLHAKAVSAGWNHSCALDIDGAAWCWGHDRNGELGVDTTTLAPRAITSDRPKRVAGGMRFTAIAAGEGFTCALTATGAAYCWGTNRDFQLGNAAALGGGCSSPCSTTPVLVAGGHQFRKLFVNSTACGVTTSDALYCWGRIGEAGVPGLSYTDSSTDPVQITAGSSDAGWDSMGSMVIHACGSTKERRAVCWGTNGFGALGSGDTVPVVAASPRLVATTTPLHGVVASEFGGCGLDDNGRAMCWGHGGLLGTDAPTHQECLAASTQPTGVTASCSAVPVAVASPVSFTSLAGGAMTVCGLTAEGVVHCWGEIPVSTGTPGRASTPVVVSAGVRFTSVSVFNSHMCGVGTDGLAYCWGYNQLGQAGSQLGGYLFLPTPVQLRPL